MNHLLFDPQTLNIKTLRNYKYTFLDHLDKHYHIQGIYDILNSIEDFKLKNIYNKLLICWSLIMKELDNPKPYASKKLKIHTSGIMSEETLNTNITEFIQNNNILGIVTMNIILSLY